MSCNGRYLVTQALAAACGHQNQCVAACNHVLNNGLLWPTELLVAENVVKNLMVGH